MRIRELAKYCYTKSLSAVRSIDAKNRNAAVIALADIRDKLNEDAQSKEKKWLKKMQEKHGPGYKKKQN